MSFLKLLIVFFVFKFTCIHAQESKEIKMLNEAISLKSGNNSQAAFEKLEEVLSKFPEYDNALFVKGQWSVERSKYSEALPALEKLMTINPDFNPLQNKLIAECYFDAKNVEKAKLYADKFLNTPNLSEGNYMDCERLLKSIAFLKTQPLHPEEIIFHNIGENINTDNNEYFPSTTADEEYLYFTKLTRSEDIWISKKINGQWAPARPIDDPEYLENGTVTTINSESNDGAHTIAPSGKYLFFTSCGRPNNIGGCDLYSAKLSGGQWGRPKILKPNVNTKHWDSQPCISSDGKKLFFVSGRPDGYGLSDIYVSEILADGTFSEPTNLGDVINTNGSEDRPFLHPDGKTLYFSSDGHPGYGKSDLYMSRFENGAWQKPINLGGQINSSNSERSIFVSTLGKTAYISKEVEKNGILNFDIFSFDMPEQLKPFDVTYIKGIVVNSKTNQPIKTSIKIFNTETNENVMSISSDEKNGDFLVTVPLGNEYGFIVNKEGYALFSQNYRFNKSNDNKPQEVLIKLQPLEKGTKFELRNVFFETAKYELKSQSTVELDNVVSILTSNPTINIMISGHTDNVGQEMNNKLLSENRAKAVMQYLIEKGIDGTRLSAKGFGSSIPLEDNKTEEGRAKNRRTEIEIL